MIIKKLSLLLIIITATTLALPTIANAHVLKIDGDIGAVLHIDPDDNPIANTPVSYSLKFSDKNSRFDMQKCHCTISYLRDDTVVDTAPAIASTKTSSTNTYTFKAPGVYTIKFNGQPLRDGDFQPFTLAYSVRVTNEGAKAQSITPLLWIGLIMIFMTMILATIANNIHLGRK